MKIPQLIYGSAIAFITLLVVVSCKKNLSPGGNNDGEKNAGGPTVLTPSKNSIVYKNVDPDYPEKNE